MRLKNSIRNSTVVFASQLLNVIGGFVVRTVFIRQLGQTFLGLNSVFESVLTLLSLAELGVGTSISFALYAPIARGDKRGIGILMTFYRKMYHIIALITAVAGLAVVPFLGMITNGADRIIKNVPLIYLLFLSNTVLSYLFSYKRTLITAYQQHYLNTLNEIAFSLFKYVLQCVFLLGLRSYIGYLLVQILCSLASNWIISRRCDQIYPFVKEYHREKLEGQEKANIKRSIVSLMFQRLSGALVTGTDNLMITQIGINLMGLYANYSMIVSILARVMSQMFQSITASVGDMIAKENTNYQYYIYRQLTFATFSAYMVVSVVLCSVMQRFIFFWAGPDWVLSSRLVTIVILNFFMTGMRCSNIIFIDASGLFNYLRLKAVLEIIINLSVSLLFLIVLKMGIPGVLLGTTVSLVTTCLWWEPLVLHTRAFKRSPVGYFLRYALYLVCTMATALLSLWICDRIPGNGFFSFVVAACISLLIALAVLVLFFGRTEEFRWAIGKLRTLLPKDTMPQKLSAESKDEQDLINRLRGLAVLGVICAHVAHVPSEYGALNRFFGLLCSSTGAVSVVTFMILSGYLYARTKQKLFFKFWSSRLKTILLPWGIWATVLYFYVTLRKGDVSLVSWAGYVLGNGTPFYYLSMLVVMYLMFFRTKENEAFLWVSMIISAASSLITSFYMESSWLSWLNPYLNPLNWMLYFALGLLIAKKTNLYLLTGKIKKYIRSAFAATLAMLAAVLASGENLSWWRWYFIPVSAALLIFVTGSVYGKMPLSLIWEKIGEWSLACYLLHLPVASVFENLRNRIDFWPLTAMTPLLVMIVTLTGIVSLRWLASRLGLDSIVDTMIGIRPGKERK